MDTAKHAAGSVASAAAGAAGLAAGAMSPVKERLAEELGNAHGKLREQAAAIDTLRAEKVALLRELEERKKQEITERLANRLAGVFEFAMGKALVKVKGAAKDPFMPRFVKRCVDTLIEAVWPDVKAEVREAALAELAPKQPLAHGDPPCCTTPRIYLKYVLFPYDRSIWRKVRHPVWWLFMLTSVIPRYGIPQIMYIFLFLVLDKGDEFQLLQFISQFKSLQFISLGVLSALIGSVQYYVCTTRIPQTCDSFAPQEQMFTLALFVLQEVVIWVAFALSFRAKKKGGKYYQMTKQARQQLKQEQQQEQQAGAGEAGGAITNRKKKVHKIIFGEAVQSLTFEHNAAVERESKRRMLYFLIYDFCAFLLCAILTVWAFYSNALANNERAGDIEGPDTLFAHYNWRFTATLYWIKAFYGLLAFPFLLLIIPGVSAIVSHARPTGYNPYGRTVPLLGKEEPIVPWPRVEVKPPSDDSDDEQGAHTAVPVQRSTDSIDQPLVAYESPPPQHAGQQPQWSPEAERAADIQNL